MGGGSVFLNVDADEFILNDIDSYVIALHKFLCEQSVKSDVFFNNIFNIIDDYGLSCSFHKDIVPDELKREYPKTYFAKFNKDAFIKLRRDYKYSPSSEVIQDICINEILGGFKNFQVEKYRFGISR